MTLIDDTQTSAFITACGFSQEDLEKVVASFPSDEQSKGARKRSTFALKPLPLRLKVRVCATVYIILCSEAGVKLKA